VLSRLRDGTIGDGPFDPHPCEISLDMVGFYDIIHTVSLNRYMILAYHGLGSSEPESLVRLEDAFFCFPVSCSRECQETNLI
jgi:hypothetical protein